MGGRIRIVVGEGRTAQRGLLRFVLEGEGFEVARETRTVPDLAIAVAEEQPDVVVLDDGIGVVAVSMVHEALPRTKIVLVWPSAVVPIGGDARVEPSKILDDLGPAVRQVAPVGVGGGLTESFDRPDWIDRIRKDPATLRDKLSTSTSETTKRPSVTQLQTRGRRLHPGRRGTKETVPAAVVALPVREGSPGGSAERAETTDVEHEEPTEWNRRLGTLALSGAAAVSALVLALALGGGRMPPTLRGGDVSLPPGVEFGEGTAPVGSFLGAVLSGEGGVLQIPTIDVPVDAGNDGGNGSGIDGGAPIGEVLGPSTGSDEPPVAPPDDTEPPDGGSGGGNDGGEVLAMPGSSGGNPFGGPPSKLGLTPAHGDGLGKSVRAVASHAHKH